MRPYAALKAAVPVVRAWAPPFSVSAYLRTYAIHALNEAVSRKKKMSDAPAAPPPQQPAANWLPARVRTVIICAFVAVKQVN